MSVNRTSLGKRISFYRSKSNLTQEVLAAKINCSREYIHHISGTCEDARKECVVEVLPIVMVTNGAPEQSIHFLGNAFAVTVPDCIKQSISIPLLRTVIKPFDNCCFKNLFDFCMIP